MAIHDAPIVCGIYKITSPSKKIYIGQSINCWWRKYLYSRMSCGKQPKLYNSFKKYGFEKHIFEIIHVCEPFELNELEIYYIALYQSFESKYGLNLKAGGGQGGALSKESRENLSRKKTGIKISENGRRNMSKAQRESQNRRKKNVYQFDLNGKMMKSFKGAREASEELGLNISGIKDCCKKNQVSAYGYYWSYDPNFIIPQKEKIECRWCKKEMEKTKHNKQFCSFKCWEENYKIERKDFLEKRYKIKLQKRKEKRMLSRIKSQK